MFIFYFFLNLLVIYNILYLRFSFIKNRLNQLNPNCKKLVRIELNLKSKINRSNLN